MKTFEWPYFNNSAIYFDNLALSFPKNKLINKYFIYYFYVIFNVLSMEKGSHGFITRKMKTTIIFDGNIKKLIIV